MTVKRVRSIVKTVDNHRDDRMKVLQSRAVDVMPRVLGEPKSTMVVRVQLFQPSGNRIRIRSGQITTDDIFLAHAFVDYRPKYYQINRITFFTPRSYSAPAATGGSNVFTDWTVQPFANWTFSTSTSNVGGDEQREFVVSAGVGTRAKVTIVPNKKDRQFAFRTQPGTPTDFTANDLVWIVTESSVPEEYWTDAYVDFEVSRWGYFDGPTSWYKGCGRRKVTASVIETMDPKEKGKLEDLVAADQDSMSTHDGDVM